MPNNLEQKKNNKQFISIIYNQNNDSPKYFELNKSKLIFFIIGLPSITLVALSLGAIGLIHSSPFHMLDTYRQNSMARDAVEKNNSLSSQIQKSEEEKKDLLKNLEIAQQQITALKNPTSSTNSVNQATKIIVNTPVVNAVNNSNGNICPVGLSALSLFRPVQGQRDSTKTPIFNLSDFSVEINRDTVNLKFNIIPAIINDEKRLGHIIVLMKNELGIQVYPFNALNTPETQINYASGESFSTQRFRPVDASFLKPRKPGNYIFTVYIFAKNGDLINLKNVNLPVKF